MAKIYILNGPEQGKSFEIDRDVITVGRGRENDIQILDKTVSRRHLEIIRRGQKYFARDLKSLNGTFFNGKYMKPDEEVEILEGNPIVIGMSVICLGKGCVEHVMPFLDSIELTKDVGNEGGQAVQHRSKTNQKIMELIYSASHILEESANIRKALEDLLDNIFSILKRIERGVILLTDPVTGQVLETISRSREPAAREGTAYSKEVVERVLGEGKAVVIADAPSASGDKIAETLKLSKIASVMCVPIMSGSRVRGALYLDSVSSPHCFRKKDLSLFMDLGKRAGIAIENAFLNEGLDRY